MTDPSSSSPPSSQAFRIEPPDATYRSLASLMASPAATAAAHLDLIPANGLSSSVAHYLGTLPTEDGAQFAKLLATSNALWSQSSLLHRSTLLFEATARSVLARINVIVGQRKGSVNWASQRSLVSWIRAIADAIHLDKASIPSSCDGIPISTLSLHTGLVAGLQAAQAQRSQNEKRGLNVRYALGRAEDEWCVCLAECLDAVASKDSARDEWEVEFKRASLAAGQADSYGEVRTVTLFLAAQVAPQVPSKKLSALPTESLMDVVSDAMLGMFQNSMVLDTIREDLWQTNEGKIALRADCSTVMHATSFVANPLFTLLGPLSRILSLALSSATRTLSPLQMQEMLGPLMERMQILAQQWQARWLSCRLAGSTEEDIDAECRAQTTQLWSIFKTLLFSYTMIFDALMEAIVDVCPSPTLTLPPSTASPAGRLCSTSNIPASYLNLTTTILTTYSHLSWITASFGTTAFDAYRRVFYEALEVLARDSQSCVNLVERLAPEEGERFAVNAGRRAAVTYYLDVVEQSMGSLPDEMILHDVLPRVRAYLDHPAYQDSFESAHSVILSIFASQKSCVCELTAYYVGLLLDCFPAKLSIDQLLHAYSTVVNAVSDKSDTVAWYALEELWRAIEDERLRDFSPTGDASSATRRRELGYVYIAQLPNVNLVLLRSMLSKVKTLVLLEKGTEERVTVCEKVFDSLGGLDASTREEGLQWWLDERVTFGV